MTMQNLLLSESGYPQVPQLIQPAPVMRDEDGYWTHPGVPDFDEDDHQSFREWLEAQGLTYSALLLESEHDNHPAYINYYEKDDGDILQWEPGPPDGDGWFTLSINDTEYGPVWVWARRESKIVKESLTVAQPDQLSDILKIVDDLVIEWVDNGMDHGQPEKRIAVRKRLEAAISSALEKPVLTDAQCLGYELANRCANATAELLEKAQQNKGINKLCEAEQVLIPSNSTELESKTISLDISDPSQNRVAFVDSRLFGIQDIDSAKLRIMPITSFDIPLYIRPLVTPKPGDQVPPESAALQSDNTTMSTQNELNEITAEQRYPSATCRVVEESPVVQHDDAGQGRIIMAMAVALGSISESLGIDPEDGGAEPILDAIAELKAAAQPKAQAVSNAQDAARYRWLRDSNNQRHEDDICVSDSMFNTYFGSDLDTAIDEALKGLA